MVTIKQLSFLCIINSLLSPAILSLPHSFIKSGVYWSVIVITLVSFLSVILNMMLIEIHCKAQHIISAQESGLDLTINIRSIFKSQEKIQQSPELTLLAENRTDTIQCLFLLFGKPLGCILSFLAFNIFIVILTQSYITFASTLTGLFPIKPLQPCQILSEDLDLTPCRLLYILYLCLFLIFQYNYLKNGLLFQGKMQVACSVYSTLTIILTIIACFSTIILQTSFKSNLYREVPDSQAYNLRKTTKILSNSCIFLMIQPQIGTIFQELNKPENFVKQVIYGILITTGLMVTLCFAVGLASDDALSNFTENFNGFTAGHNFESRPLYAFLLSYGIMALPACLSMSSAGIMGYTAFSNFKSLLVVFNLNNPIYSSIISNTFTVLPFALACFCPDLVSFT